MPLFSSFTSATSFGKAVLNVVTDWIYDISNSTPLDVAIKPIRDRFPGTSFVFPNNRILYIGGDVDGWIEYSYTLNTDGLFDQWTYVRTVSRLTSTSQLVLADVASNYTYIMEYDWDNKGQINCVRLNVPGELQFGGIVFGPLVVDDGDYYDEIAQDNFYGGDGFGFGYGPSGNQLYVYESTGTSDQTNILEYNLPTPYRIDTAVFARKYSFPEYIPGENLIRFSPDGSKMYIGSEQFLLSSSFDPSTASFDGANFAVEPTFLSPTKALRTQRDSIEIRELATPYDLLTDQGIFITKNDNILINNDINYSAVSHDGKFIFEGFGSINAYEVTVPWDFTTISSTPLASFTSGQNANFVKWGDNGKFLYLAYLGFNQNERIYQYSLSTPYDLTTISTTPDITIDLRPNVSQARGFPNLDEVGAFAPSADGLEFYYLINDAFTFSGSNILGHMTLDNPFDLRTITNYNASTRSGAGSFSYDLMFSSNGNSLFGVHFTGGSDSGSSTYDEFSAEFVIAQVNGIGVRNGLVFEIPGFINASQIKLLGTDTANGILWVSLDKNLLGIRSQS